MTTTPDSRFAIDIKAPAAPDVKFPAIGAWVELPELRHTVTVGESSYATLCGHLCAEQRWGGTATGGLGYKVDSGAWVPMVYTFGGWAGATHVASIVYAAPTLIWLTAGSRIVRIGGYSDNDNCLMQYGTNSIGGVSMRSSSQLLYVPVAATTVVRGYSHYAKSGDQAVPATTWTVITGLSHSISVATDRYVDVRYKLNYFRTDATKDEYAAAAYRVDGGAWQYLGSTLASPRRYAFSGSEQVSLTASGSPHTIEFGIYTQYGSTVFGGGTSIDGKPIISTSSVLY